VYNHNGHKINGNDTKKVRYPYLQCYYQTAYGAFIVKYEGLKFKASCWFGDMKKPQLIYLVALRDRRFDGTERTNDGALHSYPEFALPINAKPKFPGAPEDFSFVEASIYAFMPGSRISEACGDMELERFVAQPFEFLDRPQVFLKNFWRAWKSNRSPGQSGNPIPDVSKNANQAFDQLARKAGYDFIDNSVSHYHVARWTESNGYSYHEALDKATMSQFANGIRTVRNRLKAKGIELTRPQESWLCVLQSLPEELIPPDYNLNGPRWIWDNISPFYLWMYKPISERAIAYQAQRVAQAAQAAKDAEAARVVQAAGSLAQAAKEAEATLTAKAPQETQSVPVTGTPAQETPVAKALEVTQVVPVSGAQPVAEAKGEVV
jgi:hypothetical protein